ncbi:MAG: triose-phosphate isomerase [Halofilum sp. (in: g-proteobacteria)]
MRRPLVAGNWKLHGTRASVASLVSAISRECTALRAIDLAVCPTFVHIPLAIEHAGDSGLAVGAQDVSEQPEGAYTGEVAAPMLAEAGCRYAIVGHSERRAHHGELDRTVAAKCGAAARAGLTPIVCVGESLTQRDEGQALDAVRGQLEIVLDEVGVDGFRGAVVAYEPIWAIGTGRTATPEQAQEMHAMLRQCLVTRDAKLGEETPLLYGGSVKGANAPDLFGQPDLDGALVGGASLDADEFLNICRAAHAAGG